MRLIYALLFTLFCSFSLSAQTLEPLRGNVILKQKVAAERAASEAKYGVYNPALKVDCPPNEPFQYISTAGETITIPLDTLGSNLLGDSINLIEILECSVLNNGGALGNGDGTFRVDNEVDYTAGTDITFGFDTICVRICAFNGQCDTIREGVFARRAGRSYDVEGPTLAGFEVFDEFCVDDGLLEGEIACSEVLDCADDYDGEGFQEVRPTLFSITTPCIFYRASGFPGQDLVCYEICDNFGICDTFNVTYTISGETLDLPFFEDFSTNDGVYPNRANFLDELVYINNHLAADPPSINFASFDGLDRGGSPYDFVGQGDRLTSKFIDLSDKDADDNIFFKCYTIAQGLSYIPNFADSLELQFRNADRQWNTVASWSGIASGDALPVAWEFTAVPIDEEQYFHSEFQFRFLSYHAPAGVTDTWHVDYIRIEENTLVDSTAFNNDVAFVTKPGDILARYTSMPFEQFIANPAQEIRDDDFVSRYYNHFDQNVNLAAETEASVEDLENSINFSATGTVNNPLSISPLNYETSERDPNEFWNQVRQTFETYPDDTESARVSLQYTFNPGINQGEAETRNDTVNTVTVLDDYYAYDDGTAELAISLTNQQNEQPAFAIRYTANVATKLQGVRFHFPHSEINGDSELSKFFTLKVWVDTDGSNSVSYLNENEPDYRRDFINPVYPDSFTDTLQALTTFAIQDEAGEYTFVDIPAGADFYVAFQQTSVNTAGLSLGYDVQNNAFENSFYSFGGDFGSFPASFTGAIIMHPVVGETSPGNTAVRDLAQENHNPFVLFPNPTSGMVNVKIADGNLSDYSVDIFDVSGKLIREVNADNTLDMSDLPAGMYSVRFLKNDWSVRYFSKIVKTE